MSEYDTSKLSIRITYEGAIILEGTPTKMNIDYRDSHVTIKAELPTTGESNG